MPNETLTPSVAPHNITGTTLFSGRPLAACLSALRQRWADATFDIDQRDDGVRYGQFWAPSPSRAHEQLSIVVEPTSNGWKAAETWSLKAPTWAVGRTFADCLQNLAETLARPQAAFALLQPTGTAH